MLRLGEKQTLEIVKEVDFGVYLAESKETAEKEKVLLPSKQVPEGAKKGDRIEVFLYKDSKDRFIATVNEPKLYLGQMAVLQVVQINRVGAFLDWGLEKDLFLPYKEQTKPLNTGDECIVALYIDKSSRLCATMKVYPYLRKDSPYQKDDRVTGIIYEISPNFGAFVAVDSCYSALIPKKEMTKELNVGDKVSARVAGRKEDGKLDLSLREKAYIQINIDAEKVMQKLEKNGGILPFTDKAAPELIREEMDMSKNEFKRAVGNLLKAGKLIITETEIRRK
ncbi:MAG: S1 RNA-binding domain-containing protein [Lachnospiraceae bacterium]|nr:S1 RNA-binding domain-containing protein [Lachnospiraceae bacterium]